MFQNIGEIVLLFWRTLLALPLAWRQRRKVMEQFFEIGNASLLMVCVLSFFIGAVISLNFGPPLVERTRRPSNCDPDFLPIRVQTGPPRGHSSP